jgi:hypothetical protein
VERARRVLTEGGYQRQHPGEAGGAEPDLQPPSQRDARARPASSSRSDADATRASTRGSPLGTVLLALVGAGVLALLLLGLWRRTPPPPLFVGSAAPDPRAARQPSTALPEASTADALAAAGRHGEAIHVLLHAALGAIGAGTGGLDDATTSREALASAHVSGPAREALRVLVGGVEAWLFGGVTIGAEEYARCRDAFAELSGGASAQGNR